jgi:hypothetical protein
LKLTIVCAFELSIIVGKYGCTGVELYLASYGERLIEGYLSAVNAPPKTEQEAKDKLTILVE